MFRFSDAQRLLIEGKQRLIDLMDVVLAVDDKVLDNDVELIGMGEGETSLAQQAAGFLQRQFQADSQRHGGAFGRLIVHVAADLGE